MEALVRSRRSRSSVLADLGGHEPVGVPSNWMEPAELASILEVTTGTLANKRSKGLGVPYYKVGRQIRYAREDVAEWIAAGRRETR